MTKYSTDFKINAVQRYCKGNISLNALAAELKLSDENLLRGWVNLAKEQGLESLAVKHHRRRYDLDFKLKVVEYYQTHAVGVSKVAAIFNISASQVYSWDRAFKLGGLAALIPRQKGRPSLMKKKPVKSTHQSALSLSEKQAYEEEILRLKEQLFRTEMERDILKKLPPRSDLSQTKPKH